MNRKNGETRASFKKEARFLFGVKRNVCFFGSQNNRDGNICYANESRWEFWSVVLFGVKRNVCFFGSQNEAER